MPAIIGDVICYSVTGWMVRLGFNRVTILVDYMFDDFRLTQLHP